ncbi:MAG: VWA domain-containing protein [Chitinispirillaceae bacterium]
MKRICMLLVISSVLMITCTKKVSRVEPSEPAAPAQPSPDSDTYESRADETGPGSEDIDEEIERLKEAPEIYREEEKSGSSAEMERSESSDTEAKIRELKRNKRELKHSSSESAYREKKSRAAEVKAAAHNDNEEFFSYQRFCRNASLPYLKKNWNVDERYIIKVVDEENNPVHNAPVTVKKGDFSFKAATPPSGEVVLFPGMDLDPEYKDLSDYTISSEGLSAEQQSTPDPVVTISLDKKRSLPQQIPLQICFLVDATGSMEDEIQQLKDVIFSIHSRIVSHPSKPDASFSLVAYRDRGDAFLVKGYNFTSSIDTFQMHLEPLHARGGGDTPEDICAGLQYAMDSLEWNPDGAKFVFMMGDAPPQVDRYPRKNYLWASRNARERGIRIVSIGASGLPLSGEFVFRQIALLTGGEFVFLHYGETGESSGAGTKADPGKVSHHTGSNYNSRRLDDIVIDIVSRDLNYLLPPSKLVRTHTAPKDRMEHYDLRLTDLLKQVFRKNLPLKGKTLVFSPFAVTDSTLSPLSEFLWESALKKTVSIAPVNVIERRKLEDVLKENSLEMTGLISEGADKKIGKLLSADYLVFSRLHYIGSVRMCHMRLVECSTGKILSASRIRF